MADSDSDLDDFVVVSGKVYEKGYNVHSSINSTRERRVPSVTEPAKHLLSAEDFWSSVDIPNADKIKEHLRLEGISNKNTHLFNSQ
jgi:hypothetical protein